MAHFYTEVERAHISNESEARGMYEEGNQPQFNNSQYPHRIQQQPLRCANCDIDILWPPTVVQGKTYCCTGCAAGGPCNCDYSQYSSVNIAGVIHYLDEKETGRNAHSGHATERT
ncbi:MAG TPA: hypothetical protein VEL31_08235 [Ktedonobacteraceae bacterium]|nr:hypothetical protein [Ktedonobacteraceae bacterium]